MDCFYLENLNLAMLSSLFDCWMCSAVSSIHVAKNSVLNNLYN